MKHIGINRISSMLSVSIFIALIGCGKESSTDVTQRDRNRERERAEMIMAEYKLVEGSYRAKTDRGDFTLEIQTAWSKSDGASTPSAALVGGLTHYPMLVVGGAEPLQNSFQVNDGNYFKISRTLTLVIADGDKSTKMVCQSQANQSLICDWNTSRGQIKLKFEKVGSKADLQPKRLSGFYKGASDKFNVEAHFETIVTKTAGGKIAQLIPAASFVLWSRESDIPGDPSKRDIRLRSLDGTYDFYKDILTFNIEDSQIVVTCQNLGDSSLHCMWSFPRRKFEIDLKLVDRR